MSIKVTLRQKAISKNRHSLYLDFYPPIPHPETGEPSRREFLGMYIFDKPKNSTDKQHNSETLQLAQQIRQKKENQLNKPEIYTGYEKEQLKIREQGEQNFVPYFKSIANKYTGTTKASWEAVYLYFEAFTKGNLKFADLNEKFCDEFKEHLLTTKSKRSDKTALAKNTAASYFNKLKAALKQAFKDGHLQINLNSKIECIDTDDIIKQTLTIEELNKLLSTDSESQLLKNAALFSALTGMPFMEMKNLNWGQIEVSETFGIRIRMIRQKTKKLYQINISQQAFNFLGDRKDPNDKVFENLNNRDRYHFFPLWLTDAGIQKQMTFHDLRHTYGCIQIDMGTDLYTLQGNMGHSTPRQTMGYAKVSDNRKREAADKIKLNPTPKA